jgi:hypothetical protein
MHREPEGEKDEIESGKGQFWRKQENEAKDGSKFKRLTSNRIGWKFLKNALCS